METDVNSINILNLKQVDKLVEQNRLMSVSKLVNSILLAPQFYKGGLK